MDAKEKLIVMLYEDDASWIKKIQPYLNNSFWIYVPRSNLKEFKTLDISWIEWYWVYFLIWIDEDSGKQKIYIWKTTSIINRVSSHDNKKDWWQYLIFFSIEWTSKLWNDEINFLEDLLIKHSKERKNVVIDNSVSWNDTKIDKASEKRLNEISEQFIKILNFLWYTFNKVKWKIKEDEENIYEYKQGKNINWIWLYKNWKFIIKKWSIWKLTSNSKIDKVKKMVEEREMLIKEGKIEVKNWNIYFKEDVEFWSPYHSATFLSLMSVNWRDVWINKKSGKSISEEENN